MIRKKIISGTAINIIGKTLSFALQLFIITYLIKTLGKEAYGIVVLALSLVANTNLLEAGFGLSVTKYIAEYKSKGNWEKLFEVVNTNFAVSTVIAIVFSVIICLINEVFLDRIFKIPQDILPETRTLIRILLALSVIEFWSASIIRVAEGFQQYAVARTSEFVKWFFRTVFIVIATESGYKLLGIGVAYFCAGLISLFVLYFLVIVRNPELRISPKRCSKKTFKELLGFSIWIFLSKIFAFLSYRVDNLLIGIFLSPVYLTYYNVAFKIFELLRFGFSLISSTLVPVAAEINAMMDHKKLSLLFQKATKYTVTIFYPVLIISLMYSAKIIDHWFGQGFNDSIILSQLFILSLFFTALVSTGTEMIVGINKQKDVVFYAGVASVANFFVSVILIREIGVKGVVIGTLVGSAVIAVGYLRSMFAIFEVSFMSFIKDMIGKPLFGSAVCGIVLYFFADNLYAGIAALLLYFVFAVTSTLDNDDRKDFLKFCKSQILQLRRNGH